MTVNEGFRRIRPLLGTSDGTGRNDQDFFVRPYRKGTPLQLDRESRLRGVRTTEKNLCDQRSRRHSRTKRSFLPFRPFLGRRLGSRRKVPCWGFSLGVSFESGLSFLYCYLFVPPFLLFLPFASSRSSKFSELILCKTPTQNEKFPSSSKDTPSGQPTSNFYQTPCAK